MSTFKTFSTPGALALLLTVSSTLDAQMIVGTWMRTPTKAAPGTMTMAIKRIDDHHASTVLRMNGQPVGKATETWVRQ